nr:hypothetical protein [Syntrophus aciditrophicus]
MNVPETGQFGTAIGAPGRAEDQQHGFAPVLTETKGTFFQVGKLEIHPLP